MEILSRRPYVANGGVLGSCDHPEVESALGADLYRELLSADLDSGYAWTIIDRYFAARRPQDCPPSVRREIVATARQLLAGSLDVVAGMRQLDRLRWRTTPTYGKEPGNPAACGGGERIISRAGFFLGISLANSGWPLLAQQGFASRSPTASGEEILVIAGVDAEGDALPLDVDPQLLHPEIRAQRLQEIQAFKAWAREQIGPELARLAARYGDEREIAPRSDARSASPP